MKSRNIYILSILGLLSACVHEPMQVSDAPQIVSRDYLAVGDAKGVEPYVYGARTLIKFNGGKPFGGSIKDANGAAVNYKRVGDYYIFDRKLDSFTISTFTHKTTYSLIQHNEVLPKVKQPKEVKDKVTVENNLTANSNEPPVELFVNAKDEITLKEEHEVRMNTPIFQLMKEQLNQQRNLLKQASENPDISGDELFEINERLDAIESRQAIDTAVIQIYFPTGSAEFAPNKDIEDILITEAKNAKQINLYGRTDSKIANAINTKLAFERAQSAKNYFISHGIDSQKLFVSSLPSGSFIAPDLAGKGKELNRRVTIEVVTQ